jgi:hypothetical protein
MLDNRFQFESAPDLLTIEFESIGPVGVVTKGVRYASTDTAGVYNLSFGDMDPLTGYIDDSIVTNNRDSQKVLATVAYTLYLFTERYPYAIVLASGSTTARTRLYRIGIANNFSDIEQDFDVLGLTDLIEWEPFRKNTDYLAFSIRRKF